MSQNQESNSWGLWLNKVTEFINGSDVESRINKLQAEKAELMKEKNISADKILQSIQPTYDFADLQKPINTEVNEKLTSEEITQWQPIKFLFLTEGNIIKILSIMAKSDQKLNKDQSKMMSPIIKKMLLGNQNVDDLIPQIQKEQIMYFDNDLLKRIPIDNIKKFTSPQMNYFTKQQVTMLLNRKAKELYDHIAQNIDINKIFACCVDYNLDWELIINKLPVDKFADLKKESIELLSTSLMQIILKKSYKSKIYFSPEQLSGVLSKIHLILNSFDENSIKSASKDELESLIYYIASEEVKNIEVTVLIHLPAETIKKFKPDQIKSFNANQIITLLKRNDCSDHILDNLTSTQICNILDRLHEENSDTDNLVQILSNAGYIDKLTQDEIDSISTDALKIILKKSYKLENFLQPVQLEKVDTKIYVMLCTTLENIKLNIENKSKATEDLAYLIYYLTNDQIKNMDNGILIDLPAETIKKFKPDQIKNFNTDQIITLLKRNDCSDYIINNLTAEQIYNMDFQKLLELDPDIIKKFVTKHEQKIFVSDADAYLNHLGIVYKDTKAKAESATSCIEQINQFNKFNKNMMSFIGVLLDRDDFIDFILPKLTPRYLRNLSKTTLVKLINQNKISLLKQNKNISIDILKGWLEATFIIPPSKLINGEWICETSKSSINDIKWIDKLIEQFNKIIPITGKNREIIKPYLTTMLKNKVIETIKDLNHQLSAAKTQELKKEDHNKVGKLLHVTNVKYAGQEIAQNLSGDVIKFLNAKQIDLLIKYGALKHFPETRVNCFNEKEISKLDVESIQNLSSLCIKMRKKLNELQASIEKDFSEDKQMLYTNYRSGSINSENTDKVQKLYDILNQQNDFNKHLKTISKFFDTYISCFTRDQLKVLLKNGDGFLESEAIQKIKPEILFSDNEDDRKNILWKIDVMHLDFSKFGEPFYKNNFLTLDTCKKFSNKQIETIIKSENIKYLDPKFLVGLSDKQIETIIKSENIKYLDPKFLVGLSDEKIKTFNTTHLTDKQILALIDQNKFKYLNPEIISNTNMKNCLSNINSSDIFSPEQQQKLIDSELFLDLKDTALENFDSDLIVKKLNDKTTDKKFIQNELLTNNLADHNKIKDLNQDVIQKFTVTQIKILSQYKNLYLTSEQIDILLENNHISYFGTDFIASKLTDDQIKKITVIIKDNDTVIKRSGNNLCITIEQLIALSQTDKFCHIPIDAFNFSNDLNNQLQDLNLGHATADQINALFKNNNLILNENQINQIFNHKELSKIDLSIIQKIGENITQQQLQNLNLENATADQINALFKNNNLILNENQINQIFNHKELSKIDGSIIKKIGMDVKEHQLQKLNFENMTSNQLENFFAGCQNNMNLKNQDLNQLFNDFQSIDAVIQAPAFQEFYLHHVVDADNNRIKIYELDAIILLGKKLNFAKDKIFLRIVQHKLSISENQTNASQTHNSQKPIDPHMRKAYKKFIETLDNEDIKKFDLTNADKSLVDLWSIEKLLNLDDSIINSSEAIKNKLEVKRDSMQRWISFWSHVPLIGWIYKKFKSPLLENINNKLHQDPESRKSNPELNTTQKTIEQTEGDRTNNNYEESLGENYKSNDIKEGVL